MYNFYGLFNKHGYSFDDAILAFLGLLKKHLLKKL